MEIIKWLEWLRAAQSGSTHLAMLSELQAEILARLALSHGLAERFSALSRASGNTSLETCDALIPHSSFSH